MAVLDSIVCLKYVPENAPTAGVGVVREDVLSKINPDDMFAIEEAIRIKEKFGGIALGLCMGIPAAENALRQAIAMGLDRGCLISDKAFSGSDTLATAYSLAQGILQIGNADLIICGRHSSDGDTGQVGQEIAATLDLPCIINVVELQLGSKSSIICKVLSDNGYIFLETHLPVVVCVLKGINEPRVPTISGLIKSKASNIEIICSSRLNVDPSRCGLIGSPTRVKRAIEHKYPKRISADITDKYISMISRIVASAKESQIKTIDSTMATSNFLQGKEVWVVPEFNNNNMTDLSCEVLSKAKSLSLSVNRALAVFITSTLSEDIVHHLMQYGVDKVYTTIVPPHPFSESQALTLVNACKKYQPSVLLFGASVWGKWIAPYISARLHTGLTADCVDLDFDADGETLIHTRIAFGGHIQAEIIIPTARPQMATIRKGVFSKVERPSSKRPIVIEVPDVRVFQNRIKVVDPVLITCPKTDCINLSSANIVVAGGKGVGKANFSLLHRFARLIGGQVGATRYSVDSQWIDYQHQIGQTGIVIKPRLYFAFGISGASEHLAGMQDSDCIISINTDVTAPIIASSDYRIHSDCGLVLNSLIEYFERMVK